LFRGVIIFFFFFSFDNDQLNNNELVQAAFQDVLFQKLCTEGYCDINPLLGRPQYSKKDIHDRLKDEGSPLDNLFARKFAKDEWELAEVLLPILDDIKGKNPEIQKLSNYENFALVWYILQLYGTKVRKLEKIMMLYEKWRPDNKDVPRIEEKDGIVYDADNIDLRVISSISEYVKLLELIRNGTGQRFFRGHSMISYELLPSLFRKDTWLDNEKKMYMELMARCPQDFENLDTHIDKLAEMQHYGLPTRLLDITMNPLVALYFACETNSDYHGEVIMFEAEESKVKYAQSDKIAMLTSLPLFTKKDQILFYNAVKKGEEDPAHFAQIIEGLVYEVRMERPGFKSEIKPQDLSDVTICIPPKRNRRIDNQEGAFIVCGLIDNVYGEAKNNKVSELRLKSEGKTIICVINNKEEILRELDDMRINKAKVYPEIDDVADYIKSTI